MSVVYKKSSRRQFLVGTGNTLLALPFLPSLFSASQAKAAGVVSPRLAVIWLCHNTLTQYWPARTAATTPVGSSGTMETLLSSLGSMNDVSSLLTHPIYNTLRMNNQISIVRSMDVQAGGGHGRGAMGGVYTGTVDAQSTPTFDTVIESSPTVYPDSTSSYVTRALRVDFNGGGSFIKKVGNTYQSQPVYGFDTNNYYYGQKYYTLPVFYNNVFSALSDNTTPAAMDHTNKLKTNILNRVYGSYTAVKTNRRISADDKARLDQHMSYLSDLQKSLANVQAITCGKPDAPTVTQDPTVFMPIYLKLMTVAIKCGLTKFAAFHIDGHSPLWLPAMGLPEGEVFHTAIHGGGSTAEQALKKTGYEVYHGYIQKLIADNYLTPMNELEGDSGRTYLDNMVTIVMNEMGMESSYAGTGHSSADMQQMMIGSMGGRMRAGRYMALPNIVKSGKTYRLPYNAFVVTMLKLMGIPASEYSGTSNVGQGFGYYADATGSPLLSRYYDGISELIAS